jgi:hypothetical protein
MVVSLLVRGGDGLPSLIDRCLVLAVLASQSKI